MENFNTQDKSGRSSAQSEKADEGRCHPMDQKAMDFLEGLVDACSLLTFVIGDYRDNRQRLVRLEKNYDDLRRLVEGKGR